MGFLEQRLYGRVTDILGEEIGHYIHNNWKRFLDDCYINWPYGEEQLGVLHRILNSLNDNIQLTVETSCVELPFLDVMVKKEGTRLTTDIHDKLTDSFQYLPYTSSHPRHTKNNIPYNLARRICMIIENQEKREQRLQELKYILLSKKYPENVINIEIEKALSQTPQELRVVREKGNNDNNLLCLVTTYNPNNPAVLQLIRKTRPMLYQSAPLKSIMTRTKVIHSQRQPRNIKQMLTNSYFKRSDQDPEVKKCGVKRCGTCPYLKDRQRIHVLHQK